MLFPFLFRPRPFLMRRAIASPGPLQSAAGAVHQPQADPVIDGMYECAGGGLSCPEIPDSCRVCEIRLRIASFSLRTTRRARLTHIFRRNLLRLDPRLPAVVIYPFGDLPFGQSVSGADCVIAQAALVRGVDDRRGGHAFHRTSTAPCFRTSPRSRWNRNL